MKGKSLGFTILTALVLVVGSYVGYFNETVQAWLGIVSMATLLVLSTFFKSGELVKGWSTVTVITNASMIGIQVLNLIGDKNLVDPSVINGVIIGINIFIQTFLKDYNGGSIAERKVI